ncbi:MAG TPA: hypothetical protein VG759_25220 [Candidatus Angelobacter sp.]|jgi:hypothetical protein|nr:hypothetical protein [Candidatus Angelobacter sp.]
MTILMTPHRSTERAWRRNLQDFFLDFVVRIGFWLLAGHQPGSLA